MTGVQTCALPIFEELRLSERVVTVGLCDAISIALEIFRRPITNTIMLGAFARATGLVTLDSLRTAIAESEFRDAGLEQNLAALERGYNSTKVHSIVQKAAA